MGYELLTASPAGTRRRGTRSDELRALFESMLTVGAVFEPLQCCYLDDPAMEVANELTRLDYDVVGVVHRESSRVIGWLDRNDVADGPCEHWVRKIEPDLVLSDSTPLTAALHVLAAQPWAFVVAGHGVAGIITRSDLQKPPVRAVIFGILSLMEIHLDFWIQHHCPDDTWLKCLSVERVSKAEELLEQKKRRNEDISRLDCLHLCDKARIVSMIPEACATLGLESKNAAKSALGRAEALRNRVAHGQDLVSGGSWEAVSTVLRAVEKILEASDIAVERLKRDPAPPVYLTF